MAHFLIKPLSMGLVHAALTNSNPTSSPGFDGVPSSIYDTFSIVFVPIMHSIVKHFYATSGISDDWALALLNVIPKARGSMAVKDVQLHYRIPAISGLRPVLHLNYKILS